MAGRRGRDLAPEMVQGLNKELDELRGLYVPKGTALGGLYRVTEGVKTDFEDALREGKSPWSDSARLEELVGVAASLPGILERRAVFGAKAQGFMDKLQFLITTRKDGTTIEGSLNPLHVGDSRPARSYTGDQTSVPRIYLASEEVQGRVTDIWGQTPSGTKPEVWVWPTGVKAGKDGDWHSGHDGDPSSVVSLLDESVEFVGHIEDCRLPRPEWYDNQYSISID